MHPNPPYNPVPPALPHSTPVLINFTVIPSQQPSFFDPNTVNLAQVGLLWTRREWTRGWKIFLCLFAPLLFK